MQHLTSVRSSRHRRAPASGWVLIAAAGLLASNVSRADAQEKADGKTQPANRLARETSPYLLLHAHNPVDWYPWGPEAFARARAEKKPIFLSIGYSSCYWCHVMERESFMDPEIARFLNEHFVSIKVDREERPDVDQVYMAALQAFSTGGWPMSMFLMPDGRPFYGATYLPPRDREGFSGFLTLLRGVDKGWREQRAEIERGADGLTEIVRRKLGSSINRRKDPYDGALPGANSMATLDLLALHRATGEARYLDAARKTLESFRTPLAQNPAAMPLMLVAVQELLDAQPEPAGPGLAGDGAPTVAPPPQVVTATARVRSPEQPASGREREAIVSLAIKEGWHLYANPTAVEILKPTTLVLEAGQGARDLHVDYPAGQVKVLGSLGQEKVALYEGKVEIPIHVSLDPRPRGGKITLTLKLNYQACDDKVCLAPASLAIPLEVE